MLSGVWKMGALLDVGRWIKDEIEITVNTKLTRKAHLLCFLIWHPTPYTLKKLPAYRTGFPIWVAFRACLRIRISQYGNSAVSTISHGHVYFYFPTLTGAFHRYSHTLLRVVPILVIMSYSCSIRYKHGTPSPGFLLSCNTFIQLRKWREYLTSLHYLFSPRA